jgi:hypothetical protein
MIMMGCKDPGRLFVFLLTLLLLQGVPMQAAETFVILEESFESPVVVGRSTTMPTGWARGSTSSGIWNEESHSLSTPYGKQVLHIYSASAVWTTNITDRLQPGVTYTLTFNVGNGDSYHNTGDAGNNTYKAEILAGTNVIASASADTTTNDMSEQGTVTITTDGASDHLGEFLRVRFWHHAGTSYMRTLIDNVKLVAVESAEFQHTLYIGY